MELLPSLSVSAFLARAKGRYPIGYLSSDEAIHEALKGACSISMGFFTWNSHFGVVSPETIAKLLQTGKEYFQRFEDEEA